MAHKPAKTSLLVVFLTVFIDLLGFGMVLPLLPIYAEHFVQHLGKFEQGLIIGLLLSSFSLMQFLFAPLWGRLSDRIGRRPVLILGLIGSCVFYTLFGLATYWQSLFGLFATRIGAGICGATIATAQAYIADVTSLEERAKGMALIGAAFGLGFTFGPLLGVAALFSSHDVAISPWPGFLAAALSGVALVLAIVRLPESLRPGAASAQRTLFDWTALRAALATPSVGVLLLTSFVCVFAFANFESTLARLLNDSDAGFQYTFDQVLWVFAYIGVVLTVAQGFLVRRLATRMSEVHMATIGGVISIIGFALLAWATRWQTLSFLLFALAVEVVGFAFMTPSINSLISRRSDPSRQGGILGVGQSMGSLARILGPVCGNTLFQISPDTPFWIASLLMVLGLGLVVTAARQGGDFVPVD
jgi:MFS family permease